MDNKVGERYPYTKCGEKVSDSSLQKKLKCQNIILIIGISRNINRKLHVTSSDKDYSIVNRVMKKF